MPWGGVLYFKLGVGRCSYDASTERCFVFMTKTIYLKRSYPKVFSHKHRSNFYEDLMWRSGRGQLFILYWPWSITRSCKEVEARSFPPRKRQYCNQDCNILAGGMARQKDLWATVIGWPAEVGPGWLASIIMWPGLEAWLASSLPHSPFRFRYIYYLYTLNALCTYSVCLFIHLYCLSIFYTVYAVC